MGEMKWNEFFKINSKLIFIKLHFFFVYGGLGGSLPYLVLLGKSLNISATAIGLCFTTKTCLGLLSIPLIGTLVDQFQNIKYFLITFLFVTVVTGLGLIFIPPINSEVHEALKQELNMLDLTENAKNYNYTNCSNFEVNCNYKVKNIHITESFLVNGFINESQIPLTNRSFAINNGFSSKAPVNKDSNHTHKILAQVTNSTSKDEHDHTSQERKSSVYQFYQFWIFAVLVTLGGILHGNIISLSDVACYELLGNQRQLYGTQRLFGTIGWAAVCSLSGFLNDISSSNLATKDYSPGNYLMGTLLVIDLVIVSRMPMVKTKLSKDMSGDVKKVLRSCDVVLFAVGAVAIGILTTVVQNYEFWHLQDMGASQTLMGATIAIQCSIEVPFLVISAWIVKKRGSFNCLALSFFGFTIRCGLYYVIENPWWALMIDTTHGLTFALYHVSVTNFASVSAPAGTEATVLGILSGTTAGLGATTANILGGAALDKFGSRLLFAFAGAFGGVCALTFTILPKITEIIQSTECSKPDECINLNKERDTIV